MRINEYALEVRIAGVTPDAITLEGPFDGEAQVRFQPGHHVAIVDADSLQRDIDAAISQSFDEGVDAGEEKRKKLAKQVKDLRAKLAAANEVTG